MAENVTTDNGCAFVLKHKQTQEQSASESNERSVAQWQQHLRLRYLPSARGDRLQR